VIREAERLGQAIGGVDQRYADVGDGGGAARLGAVGGVETTDHDVDVTVDLRCLVNVEELPFPDGSHRGAGLTSRRGAALATAAMIDEGEPVRSTSCFRGATRWTPPVLRPWPVVEGRILVGQETA